MSISTNDAHRRRRVFIWILAGIGTLVVAALVVWITSKAGDPAGRVSVVYDPGYAINLAGLEKLHPFDINKYAKIHERLVEERVIAPEDFFQPEEITKEQILLVHSPAFLESLSRPRKVAQYLEADVAALVPAMLLDRLVLRPFRLASGGTILAARLALDTGIAINIGGGFHHAMPDAGEGFCIYADMPIAIAALRQEGRIQRVLVVDLDVHQGNGTAVCLAEDEGAFTFSMHQGNIYPFVKARGDLDIELAAGTDDATFMNILRKNLPDVIDRARPDLVILQAGCDTLAGDPLAGLAMTREGIVERDSYIVNACVRRRIPVVMTLGGGYSKDAWAAQYASIRRLLSTYGVVSRNANTHNP